MTALVRKGLLVWTVLIEDMQRGSPLSIPVTEAEDKSFLCSREENRPRPAAAPVQPAGLQEATFTVAPSLTPKPVCKAQVSLQEGGCSHSHCNPFLKGL